MNDWPRHLLDVESLHRPQIEALLKLAARYKHDRSPRHTLDGRTLVTLFFEPSTRTRSSFEMAARLLGAEVLGFQKDGSSVAKGETLADTVRNLDALRPDALVVRHPSAGAALQVARVARASSVFNAGDGAHEHPTQALLDALTLRERFGSVEGRVISIVGDIAHSRVARSNIHCLLKLGAKVRVAGPSTLLPAGIERLGCTVAHTLREAIEGADAVMALRIQQERLGDVRIPSTRDYARAWGLTARTLQWLPAHAVILHPGPINRGVEIAPDVADGERSLILDQVDSGVAVRMAALALCLRAEAPP